MAQQTEELVKTPDLAYEELLEISTKLDAIQERLNRLCSKLELKIIKKQEDKAK
jgi:hypothetical protein